MRRRDAWTLKALRALLACLCVVLAFPAASAAEPAARPVAAAFTAAGSAPAPAIVRDAAGATARKHAAAAALSTTEARPSSEVPPGAPARNRRLLYLEKRALLC